ncbi:hypothetical protein KW782_04765 [Candidatus Parcubacteria bacterium]|nr:hypothetical protein [Candidatus Parcubacteria bacterium]
MSEVEFEENVETQSSSRFASNQSFSYEHKPPKMISWLIKKGIVKTENSAQIVLLIIAIVLFTSSVGIFLYYSGINFYISTPARTMDNQDD